MNKRNNMKYLPLVWGACACFCPAVLPAAAAEKPVAAAPAAAADSFVQKSRALLVKQLVAAGALTQESSSVLEQLPLVSGGEGVTCVWEGDKPALRVAPDLMQRMEKGLRPDSGLSVAEQYIVSLAAALAEGEYMLSAGKDKPMPQQALECLQTAAELNALQVLRKAPLAAADYGEKGKQLAAWQATEEGASCMSLGEKGLYAWRAEALAALSAAPAAAPEVPVVNAELPPFFERMEAATDKAELRALLAELCAQPDPRRFTAHITKKPEVLPFEKLTEQQSQEAETWISESKVLCHVSDESLAEYNALYYPCLQRFFRKLSTAEKVKQYNMPLGYKMFNGVHADKDCIVVTAAIDGVYNEFVKETKADFAVCLIRTTGPIDWANFGSVCEIPVEVSLYAMPRAYKGVMQKSQYQNGRRAPLALALGNEKGILMGGYYAEPALSPWVDILNNAALVNPLTYQKHNIMMQGEAYSVVSEQSLVGLPLSDKGGEQCGNHVTLRSVDMGQDYVSVLEKDLLTRMEEAGVVLAEDAAYLREHPVTDTLIRPLVSSARGDFVVEPLQHEFSYWMKDHFNYQYRFTSGEKLMASLGYELAMAAIIHRKTQSCSPEEAEKKGNFIRNNGLDAQRTSVYMALTALRLSGSQATAETLLQKHDSLQGSPYAIWDGEKQMAKLLFAPEPAQEAPVAEPNPPEGQKASAAPAEEEKNESDMEELLQSL